MSGVSLDWHGERIEALMAQAAAAGSEAAAELLLEMSNERVPLETGGLRESGHVSTDASGTAAVSYADDNAVRQHEDAYFKHDPGRTRKFLEIPMLTQRRALAGEMAEEIRDHLGT